ncbi:sulfatase family protein [Pelagicoccus mobilis]|uniref:Sulfatase n=1 Tax=Pelagicoccus mobilis TaxID=415221 RepID=A0A934VNM2_9BACT|nr:sulfatase [Pelagicoccus mobilis]MBK1880101.1 sulfatase [Pelagicoccus mobilis]
MIRPKICTLFGLVAMFLAAQVVGAEQDRPNILWIVSEDNSAEYLRLYAPTGAPMPNVERLAEQGVVFNHAFSNSPVCSTARSTIISGVYGPHALTHHHRRHELVPIADGLRMFPYYLRQAGYYTSNNSKEDYNYIGDSEVWNESSNKATYRKRAPGQPFFHVQNFGTTHEGKLHFKKEDMTPTKTDVERVSVSPVHPNTKLFRYTNARYRDLHMTLDDQIGAFLEKLEADGLADDTIIFYYGDHGGVLPGSKGYLYERGLQIPMVVYAPEKWRHLLPSGPGTRVDGFVSFVDLAPTVLNLAGIDAQKGHDGKAFLGDGVSLSELNARDTNFAYADRFDEKIDFVRGLRVGNFKYVRAYHPYQPDGLMNEYRYRMLAYKEWAELHADGELTDKQAQFFKARAPEGLYDLDKDPYELNNLADDPAYAKKLKSMRKALRARLESLPDLGFYPESAALALAKSGPIAYGDDNKKKIVKLMEIADLSLLPFKKAKKDLGAALDSEDPWERYWGLVVCSSFGNEALIYVGKAKEMAKKDSENLVRLRAVEFLGLIGAENPNEGLAQCLRDSTHEVEANIVLNTVVLFSDFSDWPKLELDESWVKAEWLATERGNVSRRYGYLMP